MADMDCPICSAKVSSRAESCPRCGYYFRLSAIEPKPPNDRDNNFNSSALGLAGRFVAGFLGGLAGGIANELSKDVQKSIDDSRMRANMESAIRNSRQKGLFE